MLFVSLFGFADELDNGSAADHQETLKPNNTLMNLGSIKTKPSPFGVSGSDLFVKKDGRYTTMANNRKLGIIDDSLCCLSDVAVGLWQGSIGDIGGIINGAGQVISDPVRAWENGLGKFDELKKFLGNLETEIGKIVGGLENIPSKVALRIACELIGELGVEYVVAALTGGATAAKLMLKIRRYLDRLKLVSNLLKATK